VRATAQVPCDDDHRSVKRACSNCKKAKVKCNLADAIPCARCKRLGLDCTPHVPNKKKRLSTEDSFDISPELSASSFADPMGLNLGPLVAQPQFGAHLGAGLKDDVTDPFGPVEDVCALFMQVPSLPVCARVPRECCCQRAHPAWYRATGLLR
jgi:hypothetical protein